MKKILSFIIVLLLTIVFIGSVKAKSSDLEITNVEILEKSAEVKANIEDYKDLNINLNTLFFNKDDYVKYKISIKNNTNNTMKIDDILDNFNSEVLETSYDIDKKELKSKEEYTFTMTIKCIKDIEEERVTINTPLNIIINYDNGKTAIIDINPNTKDNIINFFIIFILSAISLIVIITKRGKKQLIGILLLVSLIPIGSNAVSTKKEIVINNDIKVYGKTAVFKKGLEVNKQLKDLAGTNTSTNVNVYNIVDTNIKEFKRSNELPDGFIPSEENTISTNESRIPIYAWFDNGIIYYYTKANNPLLNEDSSRFFSYFSELINVELDTIDSSNSVNISGLFFNCRKIEEIDLSSFNTSNVTDMMALFMNCNLLQNVNISSFDTSKVTDMAYLFYNDINLKSINISSFDTSNVSSMSSMFYNCSKLTELDVSKFDTSNVEEMNFMFMGCSSLKSIDVRNFNTSKVTTMKSMFNNCNSLEQLDISNFDTSNVTDMSFMFRKCNNLKTLNVEQFDTSSATDISYIFYDCTSLEQLDVSKWDTSKVTNMSSVFRHCISLEELDVSKWDTKNVTDISYIFYDCTSLEQLDVSKWDTSKVTNMSFVFCHCISLEELDVSKWDTKNVTDMSSMFGGHSYVGDMKIKYLDVSKWDTSNVIDMTCMFYGMGALEELDVSKWNVSKVESFNHMFCDNFKLKSLNLTRWDVSSVKTMYNMFDDNYELITVGDISHWNTESLIDVGGMFNGCKLFIGVNGTLDLSGWNTSKIKVTGEMFRNVAAEVIDLRGWDLSSITDSTWSGTGDGIYYETGNNSTFKGMAGMFKDARNLTNIYVDSNWSIPSGVSTTNMFSGAGVSQVTVVG